MAVITLSVPAELKRQMDSLPDIKWSEVLRRFLICKIAQLKQAGV